MLSQQSLCLRSDIMFCFKIWLFHVLFQNQISSFVSESPVPMTTLFECGPGQPTCAHKCCEVIQDLFLAWWLTKNTCTPQLRTCESCHAVWWRVLTPQRVPHWALSTCVFPQKLSIWPPCGAWLTESFSHSDSCNLHHLIKTDSSCHQWIYTIVYFEGFVRISQSFTLLLCCSLQGKHCSHIAE